MTELEKKRYEKKFSVFLQMIEDMQNTPEDDRPDYLIVAAPSVLGDNYAELIESLSRLAEAKIGLLIAGRMP